MMDENAYLVPHIGVRVRFENAWQAWISYRSPTLHRLGLVDYDEFMSPPGATFDDYERAWQMFETWMANHMLSGHGGPVRIQDHVPCEEYERRAKARHNEQKDGDA
jgi:hypothetical protein